MTGSVDVLIPCYNYGRFLEACVKSVLDGARRPVRILIIDDTSPDDTPAIATALTKRYPNVHYLRHEKNIGHIATYNEGIAWASGDYFLLLSADDLVAPGALERAAAFFDAHPEVGLVYGKTLMFHGDVPSAPPPQAYDSRVVDGIEFIRATFADSKNPTFGPSSVMIRTTLQHQVGGYLPELPHAGDLEMYLRCAARMAVGYLDLTQGLYRKHGTNMSCGYQHVRDYAQRLGAFEAICRTCADVLPDHEALLDGVKRTMAAELFWAASTAFDRGGDGTELNLDEYLSFAAQLDPSIRRRRAWHFLRFKRLVGPAWTSRVSSCIEAVRSRGHRGPQSQTDDSVSLSRLT